MIDDAELSVQMAADAQRRGQVLVAMGVIDSDDVADHWPWRFWQGVLHLAQQGRMKGQRNLEPHRMPPWRHVTVWAEPIEGSVAIMVEVDLSYFLLAARWG